MPIRPPPISACGSCTCRGHSSSTGAVWIWQPRGAVRLNGDLVASGCFGDVLGHPLEVVAWLARRLKARGQELDAGDIVSTGTCTGLLQVVPGQTFEADFGGLGAVKVSVE